jgi:thymidylate synthase (FAD)
MEIKCISYTREPLYTMAKAILKCGFNNEDESLIGMGRKGQEDLITDCLKSRLRGSLEFSDFIFELKGVSRTFTHQLVRHRTFSFSQQSMRFFNAKGSQFLNPLPKDHLYYDNVQGLADDLIADYAWLIEKGVPIQDARSILPQSIETSIMFRATYRGLLEMAEVRMCNQTQGEFKEVMKGVKEEVEKIDTFLGKQLVSVCERSGRCEFGSMFDRPCPKPYNQKLKAGEK